MKKIAILTSPNQWFAPFAKELADSISGAQLLFSHEEIKSGYSILFVLAYHRIIPDDILNKSDCNIVVHESELPKGKGWAPLFWQVIEGKNDIVFSLFEAGSSLDSGDIYMRKTLHLTGFELHDKLREKQAALTMEMVREFIDNYDMYKIPLPQKGNESFYPKRTERDSEISVDKSIRDQFNLLRVVDNNAYPAFFRIDGHKYKIEIHNMEEKDENR